MKNKLGIKWKASDVPTGRWKSFDKREWPSASYEGDIPCAMIHCEDEYVPSLAKEGKHPPLTVWVADHSCLPVWKWKKMTKTFSTLKEAKEGAENCISKNPCLVPVKKEAVL